MARPIYELSVRETMTVVGGARLPEPSPYQVRQDLQLLRRA